MEPNVTGRNTKAHQPRTFGNQADGTLKLSVQSDRPHVFLLEMVFISSLDTPNRN